MRIFFSVLLGGACFLACLVCHLKCKPDYLDSKRVLFSLHLFFRKRFGVSKIKVGGRSAHSINGILLQIKTRRKKKE